MQLPEAEPPTHPWRRKAQVRLIIRAVLSVLFAIIAVSVVVELAGGVADSFDAFRHASLPWLTAAFAAELFCYVCIAVQLSRLLGTHTHLGRTVPFKLGLLLYGLGSLMPGSPAPGLAIATVELRRRGMDAGRMTAALLWNSWFNVRAFLILGVFTGVIGLLRGRIPTNAQDVVVVAVIAVTAGLITSSIMVMRAKIVEWLAVRVGRLRLGRFRPFPANAAEAAIRWHVAAMDALGSPRDRSVISLAALASWVGDAICLRYALIAVGIHVHVAVLLLAYVASMIVSQIPWLPGGVGLVEATVPAVLHHYHVPLNAALAGTLAWRGIALVLPALAGTVALILLRTEKVELAVDRLSMPDPPSGAT